MHLFIFIFIIHNKLTTFHSLWIVGNELNGILRDYRVEGTSLKGHFVMKGNSLRKGGDDLPKQLTERASSFYQMHKRNENITQ